MHAHALSNVRYLNRHLWGTAAARARGRYTVYVCCGRIQSTHTRSISTDAHTPSSAAAPASCACMMSRDGRRDAPPGPRGPGRPAATGLVTVRRRHDHQQVRLMKLQLMVPLGPGAHACMSRPACNWAGTYTRAPWPWWRSCARARARARMRARARARAHRYTVRTGT